MVRAMIVLRWRRPAQDREAVPEAVALLVGEAAEADRDAEGEDERDQRRPPGHVQRADEGEGADRRERDLDHDDRQLGGHEHARLRGEVGGGAAELRDPQRQPEVRVQQVAEVADAGGAVERPPSGLPARRIDADMPGLAAEDEPDDLHRDGGGQHPEGRRVEGVDEVVALAVEADDQGRGDRDPEGDADRLGMASAARTGPGRRRAGPPR